MLRFSHQILTPYFIFRNGTIDIYEFAALWKYIQDWKQCFDGYEKMKCENNTLLYICIYDVDATLL